MISAGVLGSPISHSLSPVLHRAAYAALGIAAEYNAYEVGTGELENFLSNDGKDLNCLSLTMPLKEEALEIADHISATSHQIASGNTLCKMEDGWHLTSTDVEGFSYKEVAEIVGVPAGTVMSRLHRGRKQLREKLAEYARELGYVKGGAS